jgi:hypothetical protein
VACGNTDVSRDGLVSSPVKASHPGLGQAGGRRPTDDARQRVAAADRDIMAASVQVSSASTTAELTRTVGRAKAALDAARRGDASRAEIGRLKSDLRRVERAADERSDEIVREEMRRAVVATAAGDPVQAALFKHRARSAIPSFAPPPAVVPDLDSGAAAADHVASEWAAAYEGGNGNELLEIELGAFTYTFDAVRKRLVCARGRSTAPTGPRDQSRQKGHPRAPEGDHKGHVIAHGMGGGMDINIVNQAAGVNLGRKWRGIERLAADNPGTSVAVHLIYEDDSDRPAAFEYGVDDPEQGFRIESFENR